MEISTPLDDSPEAAHTAGVVNAASDAIRAVLSSHVVNAARAAARRPVANVLLLRGPGSVLDEAPFGARHPQVSPGCVVAPTRIITGLALSLGMDTITAPGATGDYRTDLAAKAGAMATAVGPSGDHRFGLLHVKAVDDAGHDGNVAYRVAYTAACDAMVGQLAARLWAAGGGGGGGGSGACGEPRYVIAVTGDHSTPVLRGDHSCEPVPVVMAHLADYITAIGGDSAARGWPLGPIPTPEFPAPPLPPPPMTPRRLPCGALAPVAGDGVASFDELAAAGGGWGRFRGGELMELLKKFAATQPETTPHTGGG